MFDCNYLHHKSDFHNASGHIHPLKKFKYERKNVGNTGAVGAILVFAISANESRGTGARETHGVVYAMTTVDARVRCAGIASDTFNVNFVWICAFTCMPSKLSRNVAFTICIRFTLRSKVD